MSVVYIVLPLALLLAAVAVIVFVRSVGSGQFDDLDTPAVRLLHDDEDTPRRPASVADSSDEDPPAS